MLNKTIIGLICMWMFYANAENNLTMRILSYETDQVEILDAEGKVLRTVDKTTLPEPDVTIMQVNEELELVQIEDNQGQPVWLDMYYLRLSEGKQVALKCITLQTSLASDHQEAGTMGLGGSCSGE